MKWLLPFLLLPFASQSATIWGEWRDTQDHPVKFGKITFTPVTTPLASNTVTYINMPTTCTITNGFFTNYCAGGFYDCTHPGQQTIRILVPTNNTEFNFNYVAQLATNVPVFIYPISPPSGAYYTNSIWDLRNNQWAEFLGTNTYFRYTWAFNHLMASNRAFLSFEDHTNGFQVGNSTGTVFNANLANNTLTAPFFKGDGSQITGITTSGSGVDTNMLARGTSTFTNGVRTIVSAYAYSTNLYYITYHSTDGTHSDIYIANASVFGGTSFQVKSGNGTDSNKFYWQIWRP